MSVAQTLDRLRSFAPEKSIICQVVDEAGKAWNMHFELVEVPNTNMVQLRVFHPDLKQLPTINFGSGTQYPPT